MLFAVVALVDAQTLKISSASGETGAVSRIIIELTAPSGKELVALQWEVSYPAPQLGLDNMDIAAGSASKAAEKMLACHGQPRNATVYGFPLRCGGRPKADSEWVCGGDVLSCTADSPARFGYGSALRRHRTIRKWNPE